MGLQRCAYSSCLLTSKIPPSCISFQNSLLFISQNDPGTVLIRHRVIAVSSLVIYFLCGAVGSLSSQSRYFIYPSVPERELTGLTVRTHSSAARPKIGLVLSGGGARGLAQIGVLKVLEAHNIPVDAIVGNSLGSVIGGLYASGYSTAQIESIAVATDWSELLSFSEETKRTDLFVGQKEAHEEGYLVIRFDGLEPIIPSAISGGQRLSNFFSFVCLQAKYHPGPSFDDLKIPFRAVATDLLTGRRVVLDRGSLAEAMRASVTVPLLYSPLTRDSMSLVDGGLTSNIPVDLARSMNCDVVIAVNSTSPMRNAGQLGAPWEIADQIMTIMMQEANQRQLATADVVLTPVLGGRIVSDFSDVLGVIRAGILEAEAKAPELVNLLRNHSAGGPAGDSLDWKMATVSFTGDALPLEIRDRIVREFRDGRMSRAGIREHLDRIARTGAFFQIRAEVASHASPAEVIYTAKRIPRIQKISILGDGRNLISGEIAEQVFSPVKGKLFSADSVQRALETILAICRDRGYSLAKVESLAVDTVSGNLSFILHEGRISQIKYEGNDRTRDYVIRREMPLNEGDVFDMKQAYQGIVNIKSTGMFDYVLLDVRYENDDPVLVIKVKEKSSELIRFGLHADQEHEFVGTVDIHDANFRGAWEDVSLMGRYGFRDKIVRLDYTINRIFHSYFTLSMKGYFKSRDVITYTDDPTLAVGHWDRIENGRYKENKYGWAFTFGSHFERFGDMTAELRIENHKIASISGEGYVPERFQFVGLRFQSTFDTENKFWFPTEGTLLTLSYESALKSFGSEVGFGKIGVTYESYFTFGQRHTLRPKVVFGFADATLPITEEFSMGGFRSFDGLNEDDTRGRQIFLVNMEYRYWLPFRIIFSTYVKARYDLGTISSQPEELKLINFRHGIGAEIDLDTPLGPAAFGFGKGFYFRRDLPNSPVTVGPLVFYFSVGYSL